MTMQIPVRISYTRRYHTWQVSQYLYYIYFTFSRQSAIIQLSKKYRSKEVPDLLLTHHTQMLKGGIAMKKLAMIREFIEEYYKSFSASYRG